MLLRLLSPGFLLFAFIASANLPATLFAQIAVVQQEVPPNPPATVERVVRDPIEPELALGGQILRARV